ncbi:hypothetical protein [Nitrosopumilus adriaticus]|uniref:Peptidase n=1 Tax=Nitrosopumilus adriaticus TaxID=1580092 RepID=A0A0D5C2J7_9ARCH|nr:hypothetical protein [Nitrosopumilus adriaticus]AJW70632.1 hypothetical protein NADRNF5_0938 [Nitrosopumilus adriaticus]
MLALISFSFNSSFADVTNFTTDKSLYRLGDSIKITGNVVYDSAIPTIIIQIITPSGSGLAHIDSAIPKNDGTFTKTIHAGGPTWNEDGKYTIKISYAGNLEKLIDYEEISSDSESNSAESNNSESNNPNPTSSLPETTIPKTPSLTEMESEISFTENPKMRILGFPSFDKSPQYYIDRYYTEPEYKSWFDSQFPLYSIDDVVGYRTTTIENFPSFDKSPQYYIDRYYTEPEYKSWFDSQFLDKTIYDVLGFSTDIPDWIKTHAKNWATGDISDSEFMSGLDFMIENKIIVIPGIDYVDSSIDDVPSWFRNTSHWWANDLISQQEFINSLKFLIQKDIILI